jgi:molybdopterin-guanine dinucleotide biosynthesis protein A
VTDATLTAAILAGGQARRFGGRDKCRLIVDGRSIIVRQVEVLQRVAARVLVVVSPLDAPGRFADQPVEVVTDVVPGAGAMGGVLTALEHSTTDRVVIVAGDLPFLDADVLAHLAASALEGDGAWLAHPGGVEPLVACYRRSALPVLRRAVADARLALHAIGDDLRMVAVEAAALVGDRSAARLLTNVNTPADLARVQ